VAPLPLAARSNDRGANSLRVFARLKPRLSVAQAQADIGAITSELEAAFPGTNRNVVVVPLKERVVGDTRLAIVVLMAGVAFVLLIACANVAHMLLARAAARRREVAVRLALGATRAQIIRQFLVESVLLALMSGLAGLVIAAGGVRLLIVFAPADLPRAGDIHIDAAALAFVTAVALLTGLAFGLVPAWHGAQPALHDSLKSGRGTTSDRRQGRLRDLLIASEIALALVLLSGAGRCCAACRRFNRLLRASIRKVFWRWKSRCTERRTLIPRSGRPSMRS
jgi:putative ABC transport system permease protein